MKKQQYGLKRNYKEIIKFIQTKYTAVDFIKCVIEKYEVLKTEKKCNITVYMIHVTIPYVYWKNNYSPTPLFDELGDLDLNKLRKLVK